MNDSWLIRSLSNDFENEKGEDAMTFFCYSKSKKRSSTRTVAGTIFCTRVVLRSKRSRANITSLHATPRLGQFAKVRFISEELQCRNPTHHPSGRPCTCLGTFHACNDVKTWVRAF